MDVDFSLCTTTDQGTYHRGFGVGSADIEPYLCYSGGDYGPALPQPIGQAKMDNPLSFYTTKTRGGVPLPSPYRATFYKADGLVSRIVMVVDGTPTDF